MVQQKVNETLCWTNVRVREPTQISVLISHLVNGKKHMKGDLNVSYVIAPMRNELSALLAHVQRWLDRWLAKNVSDWPIFI